LATTELYKKEGDQQERTEWHNVVFFGKIAAVVKEYLSKGSKVYIEGRLKTDKWKNKEGNNVQITKIIGLRLIMLTPKQIDHEHEKDYGGNGVNDDVPF
jgi:single-strand DNA-binding protein